MLSEDGALSFCTLGHVSLFYNYVFKTVKKKKAKGRICTIASLISFQWEEAYNTAVGTHKSLSDPTINPIKVGISTSYLMGRPSWKEWLEGNLHLAFCLLWVQWDADDQDNATTCSPVGQLVRWGFTAKSLELHGNACKSLEGQVICPLLKKTSMPQVVACSQSSPQ